MRAPAKKRIRANAVESLLICLRMRNINQKGQYSIRETVVNFLDNPGSLKFKAFTMKFFRSRLAAVLFFTLVSIGQGFSFGYLYRFSHSIKSLEDSVHSSQEGRLLVCDSKFKHSLAEKPFPTRSHEEILSFRSEPFLSSLLGFPEEILKSHRMEEISFRFTPFLFTPEPPPPKA